MARPSAEEAVRLYEQAKTVRQPHEEDWRKASAYCMPRHHASWQTDGPVHGTPNTASRRIAFDTTGARSLSKYVAILERLASPAGQRWHGLTSSDETLRNKRRVKEYFETLTNQLFRMRNHPKARFRITSNETYGQMGVYGNGPLYVGERKATPQAPVAGIKYVACAMRDIFVLIDDDGEVTHVYRRFWLNLRQFKQKFPNETLPSDLAMEDKAGNVPKEDKYFEMVHVVCPRDDKDYDPNALDVRRHPWSGSHIYVKTKEYVGEESGYQSMPYKMPRTSTVPLDGYGYSPAVSALAALGGASAMKKVNLKQGNKAVDPVLLAHDDTTFNGEVDLRPGAVNYGGVTADGKPLIAALPTGNFRVGEVLLQDERRDIEDTFFVTLFQILTETPEMTATEVMERLAEKAALLSPTMGRLQSEFLAPCIEREIDVCAELGTLPEMPPELVEAEGDYDVVYTSPMAKTMYAEQSSGFMRSVETALNVANATQDMSIMDHYNFDVAIPEMADQMAVPTRWMTDMKALEQKRAARQEQQQTEQMIQAAPAVAGAAKAMQGMT